MADVRPAQPVPSTTVSRTEFSMTSIRFMTFDLVSVLSRGRFALGDAGRLGRWVKPCNVRMECGAQSKCRAILRHDVRSLAEHGFVGVLIDFCAARQDRGTLVQPLNPDS